MSKEVFVADLHYYRFMRCDFYRVIRRFVVNGALLAKDVSNTLRGQLDPHSLTSFYEVCDFTLTQDVDILIHRVLLEYKMASLKLLLPPKEVLVLEVFDWHISKARSVAQQEVYLRDSHLDLPVMDQSAIDYRIQLDDISGIT